MLNLTAEAKQAWLAQTRQVNARVTIGTTVYNADKIMSIEYDSGSISGETFQIGSFYQNSIKVVLVGILESLANDNKVKLEFAVKVGQAFEWVNMGTFYVTELDRDRNSNRTTFTAVDASVYLGKNYAPKISFPNSLKNLVTDIANQCGVQVNFASMTHLADVSVKQPPNKHTCRQVISMVAQIHGGFARINRNDQLEVTRLMSSDIELSPSHYLLKGLTKNETTYRTDGIIVKIGENEEDVLKAGTTTGSAVINLENPLMTQTLLDEMWRVVSIISYYPFNLKWRGIPNLEAGDWITIVDKQGTRYRVPNLSYKLSFKGGLSAESSANTTATSNVQHKLRGTLTQRVEDVEGYINASGGRSYTGLDVPDNEYLKKGDTWYKPDGDDTAILVYDGKKWEEVASPEVFRKLQADFDELDRQAKEAFEQVDTLVQESPETKRLAQEAQEAVNLANKEITKLQTSVSDTKTALENAEQEFADSLATTTRELTAKISGIDVGGRNILRGTKDMRLSASSNWADGTWRQSNTGTTKNVALTDFPLSNITQGIEITSDSTRCGITQDSLKMESGEYTLSYYVKAKTPNTVVRLQAFWNAETGDIYKNITLTDTNWTRVSITSELKVNQGTIAAGYIYVETPNSTITVAAPFEHRSNKEAEWSPAPEDFQSDLSNTSIELSTKITESAAKLRTEMSEKYSTKNDLTALSGEYNSFKEQTAKKFSQQVSSIQTIQTDTTEAQKLANDALGKANSAVASATNASSTASSAVSTANTAKSNADKAIADVAALTKTVSSQSTRIDQTSNRIDQVASGVTEIGNVINSQQSGGMNLWRFTKDYDGSKYDKWGQILSPGSISYKNWTPSTTIDGFGVQYIATAWDDLSQCVPIKHGGTYTLSAMVKLGSSTSSVGVYIEGATIQQIIVNGVKQATIKSAIDNLSATEYKRVSVTYKNTGNKDYSYARFEPTTNSTMYIYQPMFNEGYPLPWSPHSEDTQSQIDGINNNLQQVGNRNLALNSGRELKNKEYRIAYYNISPSEGKVLSNGCGHLVVGKKYTIIVCLTTDSTMREIRAFLSEGYQGLNGISIEQNKKQVVSFDFTARYYGGKYPSDNTDNARLELYRYPNPYNITGAEYITVHWVKIVDASGVVVKDWSPAPEDQQSQIDGINNNLTNNYYQKTTVDSKLSTAVSGITAQYTQDITTRLGNYYDKATIDSKLTIDGQGITTYVKSTQSKLDNMTGFRNLWKHTKDYDGSKYDKWGDIFAGDITYKYRKPYTTIDGFGVQYIINNWDDMSQRVPVKRNSVYTLSAMIKLGSESSVVACYYDGGGARALKILVDGKEQPSQSVISGLSSTEYRRVSVVYNTGSSDYSSCRFEPTTNSTMYIYQPMFNEGEPLPWEPNTDDMVTLSQYTEVKQLADRISSTVYDSTSGLVTKTTQLAGKYAIQNLNSYGEVLSSLNMNGGNVRIKGGLIDLDGNVRIHDAFVTNLKANSILANEITAKATTIVNAKIANLDAGVITTGILKGTNLSLNLGTGEVQFKKGRIQAPNNTLDIQVNTGIMKVLNTNGEGVTFQNGNLYFSNTSVQGYYGSIKYNQDFGGPSKGVKIDGYGGIMLASRSQKDTLFSGYLSDIKNGASLSIVEGSSGEGYIDLLSQSSITLAINKKRQATVGYDFTGITIQNGSGDLDMLNLTGGTVRFKGKSLYFNNENVFVSSKAFSVNNNTNSDFSGPVTFRGTTTFNNSINVKALVNGKYLAYGKSMDITFELKNAYTPSAYLEVTQGITTYKIPLKS